MGKIELPKLEDIYGTQSAKGSAGPLNEKRPVKKKERDMASPEASSVQDEPSSALANSENPANLANPASPTSQALRDEPSLAQVGQDDSLAEQASEPADLVDPKDEELIDLDDDNFLTQSLEGIVKKEQLNKPDNAYVFATIDGNVFVKTGEQRLLVNKKYRLTVSDKVSKTGKGVSVYELIDSQLIESPTEPEDTPVNPPASSPVDEDNSKPSPPRGPKERSSFFGKIFDEVKGELKGEYPNNELTDEAPEEPEDNEDSLDDEKENTRGPKTPPKKRFKWYFKIADFVLKIWTAIIKFFGSIPIIGRLFRLLMKLNKIWYCLSRIWPILIIAIFFLFTHGPANKPAGEQAFRADSATVVVKSKEYKNGAIKMTLKNEGPTVADFLPEATVKKKSMIPFLGKKYACKGEVTVLGLNQSKDVILTCSTNKERVNINNVNLKFDY